MQMHSYSNGRGQPLPQITTSLGHTKSWLSVFKNLDTDHDGFIRAADLRALVDRPDAVGISRDQGSQLLATADKNMDRRIDFEEFCLLMASAKQMRMQNAMFRAAQAVVPKQQREKAFDELQEYNCMPPPIFLLLITIAEVAVYIYYVVSMNASVTVSGPVPIDSPLIYNPYRRYEAWRYVSYMFIHIGIYHILFNSLTQLILGLPLELVHKFWRVGLVYVAGVIAGSLAVSVCDPTIFLAGASGGVYALIAAHVSNLIVNWQEMEYAIIRLVIILILIISDLAVALYNRYATGLDEATRVSYVAHIGGFIAGLLMGIVVLRNFQRREWERIVWWIALVGFLLLFALCVCWNIFFYAQYPKSQY